MKPHAILLQAPRELDPTAATRPAGAAGAPAILQRSDDDFIDAALDALRSGGGRAGLAADLAATRTGGVLKLFQPMQRQFHLAVIEAVCDVPGMPRIDPARVESAGMVLRRIQPRRSVREGESGGLAPGRIPARSFVREGWMRAAGRLRGWVEIDDVAERDDRHDPLPANRLSRKALGPPALARELANYAAQAPGALFAEQVIPLFLTPPDVCADAGKTLYYGLVPTTSSDLSDAPGEMPPGFEADSAAFRDHLVAPLRGEATSLPGAGSPVQREWRDIADIPPNDPDGGHQPLVTKFVLLLRQLAIEFDAFGDSAASRALYAELQTIALPLQLRIGETTPRTVAAGAFLRACVPVLLERDKTPSLPRCRCLGRHATRSRRRASRPRFRPHSESDSRQCREAPVASIRPAPAIRFAHSCASSRNAVARRGPYGARTASRSRSPRGTKAPALRPCRCRSPTRPTAIC
jgi:hypothetical protein